MEHQITETQLRIDGVISLMCVSESSYCDVPKSRMSALVEDTNVNSFNWLIQSCWCSCTYCNHAVVTTDNYSSNSGFWTRLYPALEEVECH